MRSKSRGTKSYGTYTAIAVGLLLGSAATAQAQLDSASTTSTTTTLTSALQKPTTHVIEWDLTSLPGQLDGNPGAMVVDTRGEDNNRLWFVTRLESGSPQKVYRFTPPRSLSASAATWTGWDLRPPEFGVTGGVTKMRPSHDRRFLFVRMPGSTGTIQRIDTSSSQRTVWSFAGEDQLFVSDITVDDRNDVFTTGVNDATGSVTGYVQMLDASMAPPLGSADVSVTVKRWVGLRGAGQCVSVDQSTDGNTVGPSGVCNSGIDVHPSKQNLVYFVEQGFDDHGYISELNVDPRAAQTTADGSIVSPVRRWSLATLSTLTGDNVTVPRALKVDRSGKVWINTSSGHLVSLDPSTSRMTKHKVPDLANDLWGLSPDTDVVGYTAAGTSKVAMLFPRFNPVTVPAENDTAVQVPFSALATTEAAAVVTGNVPGDPKVVPVQTTRNPSEGTFVEAFVNQAVACGSTQKPESLSPLGITANWTKAQGTFFYTVGFSGDTNSVARRVGHVRLPNKERLKFARDDDDADEGFDATTCAGYHAAETDDNDADGVSDTYDTPTARENATNYDPSPIPAMTTTDYPVATTSTTLALIATARADVATTTIAVDVYNSLGTLVGTSGPMIGTAAATFPSPGAGNFTVRVRNMSGSAATLTPTIIIREPFLQ